jgi:hypothetical protein
VSPDKADSESRTGLSHATKNPRNGWNRSGAWPNLAKRFDMPDGTPFDDNDGLWRFGTWADTEVRTGPKRNRAELAEQRQVIRALTGAAKSVLYAVRFPDGVTSTSSRFPTRKRLSP